MFHPYSFYLQKHKNAKIKRESVLPFFSFPLLLHLVIHTPNVQTAFYYVPFRLLGYPILPFGVSHFTIWDVPFCHLGCSISPFGISHFTIWGIPFHLLGYPISPFGVSHFAIWGIPFRLLGYPILPFGMSHFAFWDVPFCLLGCPILPFGVSHFTIWGIFSAHLYTMYSHDFGLSSSFFRCQSLCFFFPFASSCFFGIRLAG